MHLPATILQLISNAGEINEAFAPIAGFGIAGVGWVFRLDHVSVLKELVHSRLDIGLVQASSGGREVVELVARGLGQ